MRRLDGPGAAGGPGRACDPGEVEVHQQRFAVRPGNRYVRDVRRARSLPAVDQRIRYDRDQTPLQLVAQLGQPCRQALPLFGGLTSRDAQPDDAGHILGPGADAELLAAAVDDGLDRLAVAHDERADPLGSADLMAGDGEERAVHVAERYRNLPERLDGVRVKQDARLATSRGQLGP